MRLVQNRPRKPARNVRAHDARAREQHGPRVRRRDSLDDGQDARRSRRFGTAARASSTASIDRVDFREPIHLGDLVVMKASVNYVGRSSMEVGVRVEAEDLLTGRRRHTNSCYLTFVAVDRNGRPIEVAGVRARNRRRTAPVRRGAASADAGAWKSARPKNASKRRQSIATEPDAVDASLSPDHRIEYLSLMQLFTVEQANRTLPLVRKIVEDVVQQHRRWRETILELDLVASSARADEPSERAEELERDAQALAREIDGYQRELEELGIQLKDPPPRPGRFPERDGRPARAALLAAWRARGPVLARGRRRLCRPAAAVAGARRLSSRRLPRVHDHAR